jgi:hypothetical protein
LLFHTREELATGLDVLKPLDKGMNEMVMGMRSPCCPPPKDRLDWDDKDISIIRGNHTFLCVPCMRKKDTSVKTMLLRTSLKPLQVLEAWQHWADK